MNGLYEERRIVSAVWQPQMPSYLSGLFAHPGGFFSSDASYADARVVILGAPMDWTTSFRPGTRFGPRKIREVADGLEEYSLAVGRSLDRKSYVDIGDLILPLGNVEGSLQVIEHAMRTVVQDGKRPLLLGGEHLVSYPALQAVVSRYGGDLAVVHLDAHADLRDSFFGERLSHATVLRRICEIDDRIEVYQFGIRSGVAEEVEYARQRTHLFPLEILDPLREALPSLKGRPVYLTFDIDVVDPAYAPGTGTPEPGGCSAREALAAVAMLGQLDLVGADLVEVSPEDDPSGRTAILAAKIIRELLIFMGNPVASAAAGLAE